jgi:two-component system CheB/CheR fusion protein
MRLKGLSVLLVEDDVDNLELLAACLESEGAHVYSAGSIAGALAMTIGKRIDVVVSDLELPDGEGCALLHQLAQSGKRSRPPAIAVTGYSQQSWRNKAADCGFTRYAVKPFSLEDLVKWVHELSRASDAAGASGSATSEEF